MIVAAVSVPVVVIVFIDYMVRGVYDVVFFILVAWFVGGVGRLGQQSVTSTIF